MSDEDLEDYQLMIKVIVEPQNNKELGAMNGVIEVLKMMLYEDEQAKIRVLNWCKEYIEGEQNG